MNKNILFSTLLAFVGSCAPAPLFNINRNKIFWAGIAGIVGWLSCTLSMMLYPNQYLAVFIGAFFINVYSEIMARVKKSPALMFYIPALFPLVPGYKLYTSILSLIQGDTELATSRGLETTGLAIAICFGIMVSTPMMKSVISLFSRKSSNKLTTTRKK